MVSPAAVQEFKECYHILSGCCRGAHRKETKRVLFMSPMSANRIVSAARWHLAALTRGCCGAREVGVGVGRGMDSRDLAP